MRIGMYYYRVTIAYKGTQYFGWQAQSVDTKDEGRPTIEGTILQVLKKITKQQACTISGASRTDAGVHAQGQIAKISIAKQISAEHLLLGLNSLLPADIRILTCAPSNKAYQPSRSSAQKEYHYYFTVSPLANVASADIALNLPLDIMPADTLELLRAACQLFVGEHDFYNFTSRDVNKGSSIRRVFYCDIHRADFAPLLDNMYYLKIVGDGFLKYMIRYLMGALIELARARIGLDDFSRALQRQQEHKLSTKAKAKGLHLICIDERV